MTIMKKGILPTVILCALLGLSGCVTTGSPNTLGPARSTDTINADNAIADTIKMRLNETQGFSTCHVNVDVFNGYIVLSGQVSIDGMVHRAEEIAHSAGGVRGIYNGLTVGDNTPTWRRVSDSMITARVNRGIDNSTLSSLSRVHVVTENGIVFLMGSIQRYEADGLAHIAGQVDGVNGVVKAFEYVD